MAAVFDLTNRLDVAIRAAHTAGQILRDGFHSQITSYHTKSNRNDPVTEFDLRADRAIVDIIGDRFPQDALLTEESGGNSMDSEGQWVIDPLDGTNNFSKRVPHFCVSIAFCCGYRPLLACIYDPMRNETYTAMQGAGAWLNEAVIHVSDQQVLDGAFLAVGTSIYPRRREMIHKQMPRFLHVARALRTSGSAALDLAYVAAGRFDASWYPNLHWWDVAAGILLIEQAGGRCTNYLGQPFSGATSSMVASNTSIHHAMLDCLEEEPDAG